MSTVKDIAQWAVDNRKNDSVSDLEYYHDIVKSVENLTKIDRVKENRRCYSKHGDWCHEHDCNYCSLSLY